MRNVKRGSQSGSHHPSEEGTVCETATRHQPWIDVLRIAAAFAIVVLHCAVPLLFLTPRTTLAWQLANLVSSLARWAVPAFVMVSGYLLLDLSREDTPLQFYRKRMSRILVPLAFWFVVYSSVKIMEGAGVHGILETVLRGHPGERHLWFLVALSGLYLFTPFLRSYVRSAGDSEVAALVVLLMLVTAAEHVLAHFYFNSPTTIVTRFLPYLGYYLAGFLVSRHTGKTTRVSAYIGVVIASGGVVAACNYLLSESMPVGKALYLSHTQSPMVMCMSLAVLLAARRMRLWLPNEPVRRRLSTVADATLGVYLVHPLVIRVLSSMGITSETLPVSTGIPIMSLSVFAISLLLSLLLLSTPGVRTVVGGRAGRNAPPTDDHPPGRT